MSRPCTCERLAQCRLCWLYHHDTAYRALWDQDAARDPYAPYAPYAAHTAAAPNHTPAACTGCRGHEPDDPAA